MFRVDEEHIYFTEPSLELGQLDIDGTAVIHLYPIGSRPTPSSILLGFSGSGACKDNADAFIAGSLCDDLGFADVGVSPFIVSL
jgi:hypothetical protein